MTIQQYIDNLNQRYKLGNATEHTFRGDLQQLLESLVPDIRATNEPKRQSCGAPDYILTKRDIPVGFIEAKDIGDKGLQAIPENFSIFSNLIREFSTHIGQNIKSSKKLAEMMAGKARLLSDIITKALLSDENNQENSTLREQMLAFKEILIHDITPQGFADVYAQTIAYGMFAARLHDSTLPTFGRQEAAELIPKTNPFLRKLFGYIAGPEIDDRIKWVVDSLADIFQAANVDEILHNYGKSTKMEDPIIHFYETFLSEYDPKLRKSRGVWYTPQPVVNFIVRAVDDILKTEFNLTQGLADTSKTNIKLSTQTTDNRQATGYKSIAKEVHKVQILDPATGTGTFLAEIIRQINAKFQGQQGLWSDYVDNHLLPRLNGFELLMASYAMAHLKLDLLLRDSGYKSTTSQRFRVYLTNSLEESHPDTGTLFANWLSTEANEANHIKRDTPVMCIIGNPPYSGISSNNGEWITKLIEDYKYIDGEHFNERKHWLNDDYVKFIRYAQHFIEKNGSGILAYINPHGFLDNPTFRGMRWHLLQTYDKIYTIDLHGNSKKKELSPDGSPDVNVFDIQQGVSINFFIKTGAKKPNQLGKVYHYDLYGKRDDKYNFLQANNLANIKFQELQPKEPNYFFVNKDFEAQEQYEKGFLINELFPVNNVGIVTAKDKILIDDNKDKLLEKVSDFYQIHTDSKYIKPISYRPFDNKYIYFDTKFVERSREKVMQHFLKGDNLGLAVCRQFKSGENYYHAFISDKIIESSYVSNKTSEITSTFPLYLYPEDQNSEFLQDKAHTSTSSVQGRTPNLNTEILKQIADNLSLNFTNEKETSKDTFAPIDILDYIYAVLHSPTYRDKYKEFLKIDFPRVPYPQDIAKFWQLVSLGSQLRGLHLLESPILDNYITQYPIDGDNTITKIQVEPTTPYPPLETKSSDNLSPFGGGSLQGGGGLSFNSPLEGADNETLRIYINPTQYFDQVPKVAWEFYIGGYQPAQKWLKDRKDQKLQFEDILHYQKIINTLTHTHHLMQEIEKIEVE